MFNQPVRGFRWSSLRGKTGSNQNPNTEYIEESQAPHPSTPHTRTKQVKTQPFLLRKPEAQSPPQEVYPEKQTQVRKAKDQNRPCPTLTASKYPSRYRQEYCEDSRDPNSDYQKQIPTHLNYRKPLCSLSLPPHAQKPNKQQDSPLQNLRK